ncbi:hypothetical protein C8J57DRAFT_1501164 [Mycena rebaudengoi]|nr:hypothetical protein C8J57DRAFT_1501164 [Mycena rebaudengoi]
MRCVCPSKYDDTATTPRFTTHAHRALHSPHLHISDAILAPRIDRPPERTALPTRSRRHIVHISPLFSLRTSYPHGLRTD